MEQLNNFWKSSSFFNYIISNPSNLKFYYNLLGMATSTDSYYKEKKLKEFYTDNPHEYYINKKIKNEVELCMLDNLNCLDKFKFPCKILQPCTPIKLRRDVNSLQRKKNFKKIQNEKSVNINNRQIEYFNKKFIFDSECKGYINESSIKQKYLSNENLNFSSNMTYFFSNSIDSKNNSFTNIK